MHFASDNTGPAHPRVLEAMIAADTGYAMPYGNSGPDAAAVAALRAVLEAPEAAIYPVATGSAANSLALATLCQPYQTIFCSDVAHIHEDECNAPEFFTGGAKLTTIGSEQGKIPLAGLEAAFAQLGGSVHNPQLGPISITQGTEKGTLYTLEEIQAIGALAKARGVPFHMDGARFANAVAALGCTPAEMTWKAGVDALSFGGTKNGCPCVEVVVFFDPARAWEFELRRKRAGQLFSKHRYLAAQLSAYVEGGLWLEMARASNAAAATLAEGLRATPGVTLMFEPEINMIFATLPEAAHARLKAANAQYYPGPEGSARMVCDWSARPENTKAFLDLVRG